MDDTLIRITAWFSFATYLVAVTRSTGLKGKPAPRDAKWFWMAGSLWLLAHTACAFHFRHAWSHQVALAETARQTAELTGWRWGGGLWLNYGMTTIWLTDAWWWSMKPDSYRRRPRGWNTALHVFFAFMWVNGLIVFGSPASRSINPSRPTHDPAHRHGNGNPRWTAPELAWQP